MTPNYENKVIKTADIREALFQFFNDQANLEGNEYFRTITATGPADEPLLVHWIIDAQIDPQRLAEAVMGMIIERML